MDDFCVELLGFHVQGGEETQSKIGVELNGGARVETGAEKEPVSPGKKTGNGAEAENETMTGIETGAGAEG